jgi:hypothetical protein
VAEWKVRAARELEQRDPEVARKVLAGKMTLDQARRALRSAERTQEGVAAPKRQARRPASGVGAATGNGAATAAGVKPQDSPTEPGEAEVEPSTDVGGVGPGPWAQWLRSGFRGIELAEVATELIRRLGVDRAARLRDALAEALAART